jgi:hypothetical protein
MAGMQHARGHRTSLIADPADPVEDLAQIWCALAIVVTAGAALPSHSL